MSKLEELINQLCPDGVEYVKINEIADTFIGLATSVTKYKTTNGVQLLHNSDIADGQIVIKNLEYLDESFVKKNEKKLLKENDVITVHTGDVGTSAVITKQYDGCIGFTTISSRIKNTTEITPEFLCRFLNSNLCKSQIVSKTISDRSNLNLASFDEIVVPLPPLPVQEEIVRILDNITSLTAELTKKLAEEKAARQKQYEYYRDSLLSFDEGNAQDGVRWMKLIECCDYVDYRGKTPKKVDEGIFLVTAKNIRRGYIDYDSSQEYIAENDYSEVMHRGVPEIGDILFTTEAPCGYVAQVDRTDIALAQRVIKYRGHKDVINNTFLKYVLLGCSFQEKLMRAATGSTVKGIKGSKLHQLTVPVPPLEEQQRIVNILDRFDKLCNDISEGLPAEIEARKKQYEYYRDKLLTFKEKEG